MSLEVLSKEILQMWILLPITDELNSLGRLKQLNLDLAQSSYTSIALFERQGGECPLWHEFDMTLHTMCRGILWYSKLKPSIVEILERANKVIRSRKLRRAPLRPDISILKDAGDCKDCSGC